MLCDKEENLLSIKKIIVYYNDNYCVACGKQIPEGQMVCRYCIKKEEDKELNDKKEL